MKETIVLINDYYCLAKEVFGFIQEHFDGIVPAGRPDPEITQKTKTVFEQLEKWHDAGALKSGSEEEGAIILLEEYLHFAETYFCEHNPEKTVDEDRASCRNTILNSVQMIANLTVWLGELDDAQPEKIAKQLSLNKGWHLQCVHSGYELQEPA